MMERTYIIPLRKAFMRARPYKKTKRAVSEVRKFLQRHMKSEDIRIGEHLNLKLWQHGAKNPPARVEVIAKKEDDNIVRVELVNAPQETTEEAKAAEVTSKETAKTTSATTKKEDKKAASTEVKEEKTPTATQPKAQEVKQEVKTETKQEVKAEAKQEESQSKNKGENK